MRKLLISGGFFAGQGKGKLLKMPGRQDRMCRDALNNVQAVHAAVVPGAARKDR